MKTKQNIFFWIDQLDLSTAKQVLFLEWKYGKEIALICYCFTHAIRVHSQVQNPFWFHSLVYMLISTFGGGIIGAFILGTKPPILANDLLVPVASVAWYIVHCVPNNWGRKILLLPVVKEIRIFLCELQRANSCVNMVIAANKYFVEPSKYYPTAMVGPILCGTLSSVSGGFFPLNKGLQPIEKTVPWNIQCAFMSATFYHLMINDKHILGSAARNLFFGIHITADRARLMCVFLFSSVSLIQSWQGPNFNPFRPIHKILYQVLKLPRPAEESSQCSKKNFDEQRSRPKLKNF